MTLKELKSKFDSEAKTAGIENISLYECSINEDADYFECEYYDTEEEDKVDEYNKFAKDFFDKYKIVQNTYYNSGSYGDPYYNVNLVFRVGESDLYYQVSYMYDSYNENEFKDDLKEVTPVQEVKIRFR